ncbi:hypothetical protein SEVIR_2G049167v4 [Setaria viridis]
MLLSLCGACRRSGVPRREASCSWRRVPDRRPRRAGGARARAPGPPPRDLVRQVPELGGLGQVHAPARARPHHRHPHLVRLLRQP